MEHLSIYEIIFFVLDDMKLARHLIIGIDDYNKSSGVKVDNIEDLLMLNEFDFVLIIGKQKKKQEALSLFKFFFSTLDEEYKFRLGQIKKEDNSISDDFWNTELYLIACNDEFDDEEVFKASWFKTLSLSNTIKDLMHLDTDSLPIVKMLKVLALKKELLKKYTKVVGLSDSSFDCYDEHLFSIPLHFIKNDERIVPKLFKKKKFQNLGLRTIGSLIISREILFNASRETYLLMQDAVKKTFTIREELVRSYESIILTETVFQENIYNRVAIIFEAFLFSIKKDRDKKILIRLFKEGKTLEQVGVISRVTSERIRQLKIFYLDLFKKLIHDGSVREDKFLNFTIRVNLESHSHNKIWIRLLSSFKIISGDYITSIFKEEYGSELIEGREYLFDLLCWVAGVEMSAKTVFINKDGERINGTSRFSPDSDYYLNKSLLGEEGIELFYRLSNIVYDVMKEKVIPIVKYDLISEVKKRYKFGKKYYELIDDILNTESDFELVDGEEEGYEYYQIAFNRLWSIANKAERIFYEQDNELTLEELKDLFDQKMIVGEKPISSEMIRTNIRHSEQIHSIGKRKIYYLGASKEESGTLIDYVVKALEEEKKPLRASQIVQIVKSRKDEKIENKNLGSIISAYCYDKIFPIDRDGLKGNEYILPSWKNKYREYLIEKGEKTTKSYITFKDKAYELLKGKDRPVLLHLFRKEMIDILKCHYATSYQSLNDSAYFILTENELGRTLIDIQPGVELYQSSIGRAEKIINRIIEFFEKNRKNEHLLRDVVKNVHKEHFPTIETANIYKAIAKSDLFRKELDEKHRTVLKYLKEEQKKIWSSINAYNQNNYQWELLKGRLFSELQDLYKICFSKTVRKKITLEDLLELFKSFLERTVPEYKIKPITAINNTKEILHYLFYYFNTSTDHYYSKLIHKDFVLRFESLAIKTIFFVDEGYFKIYKEKVAQTQADSSFQKPALGVLLKQLGLYGEDGYNKNLGNFLDCFERTYNIRNNLAHIGTPLEKRDWDISYLNDNIKNALMSILYMLYKKYKPILA